MSTPSFPSDTCSDALRSGPQPLAAASRPHAVNTLDDNRVHGSPIPCPQPPAPPRWRPHPAALRFLALALFAHPAAGQEILRLAADHFRQGRFREAEESYRRVLSATPQSREALVGVARCRMELGGGREAIAILGQVVSLHPDYRPAQRAFAFALVAINQFEQGESRLVKLLEQDPADKESWYYLGLLMYHNGYYRRALAALEKAAGDPQAHPARRSRTEVYRAVCLERTGRTREAEAAFAKLVLQPEARKEPDLLLVYAQLFYETGRLQQALQATDAAVQENPWFAMGHFWRARVLLRLKRLGEAAAAAEEAVRLSPQLPFPRSLLVRIYQAQGRTEDAARQAEWLREFEDRRAEPR